MRCLGTTVHRTYLPGRCLRNTRADNGLCHVHARVAQREWSADDWARHEERLAKILADRVHRMVGD